MGVKLMVEVLDHAPETLTPRERYVLVVLAENARDSTRVCWPGIEDDDAFIRRSRLTSRSQRYAVIQALVTKKALERSRRGQKWVRAEYRIAKLADSQGPGNQDPEATGEVPETGTLTDPQGPEKQDAEKRDAEAQGPGNEFSGSRIWTLRVPETRTPSPHTPQPPQGGVGGEDPQSPPPANPAATARQQALFPIRDLKLSESVQLVFDWGRWNGYEDTTPDEARAVLQAFRRRYGSKPIGYIRTVAGPDGGGFDDLFREIRDRRAAQTKAAIEALEETQPDCEHGTRAGRAAHPVTGGLLCPLCRTGAAAEVGNGSTTDEPVAAIVNAYRVAYQAALDASPWSSLLIDVTQEAAALLGRGANGDLLIDLARRAGARGEGLITAATRGDQQ